MAGRGCADVPSAFSAHPRVLTDRNNRIRDLKYPTIGPVEHTPPWIADRYEQRFVYDGQSPVLRETYRYAAADPRRALRFLGVSFAGRDDSAGRQPAYDKADSTRYFHLANGNMVAVDSDGTTDVNFADREGRPWFSYRACGGRRFWPTASSWHSTDFGQGVSLGEPNVVGQIDKDTRSCLNTGSIDPQSLPGTGFAEFLPFWQWASDGDLMMGRVGVAGWDGEKVNWGLFIGEKPPEQAEAKTWDWSDWRTWAYLAGGVALVIGGVALTIATGGLAGFVIGGALAGAGFGFGLTGGATRDFGAAVTAGVVGAVAGGVAGAASYGAMALVAGGLEGAEIAHPRRKRYIHAMAELNLVVPIVVLGVIGQVASHDDLGLVRHQRVGHDWEVGHARMGLVDNQSERIATALVYAGDGVPVGQVEETVHLRVIVVPGAVVENLRNSMAGQAAAAGFQARRLP